MLKRFPYLIVFLLILAGCDKTRIIDRNVELPEAEWNYLDKLPFEFEVKDTNLYYNIYLNLRLTGDYPFSNMFVLVYLTSPDSVREKHRYELTLANNYGRWIEGKGLGDIYYFRRRIMHDMRFKKPGKYTLELEQNMRVDNLPEIMNMGVRVEATE